MAFDLRIERVVPISADEVYAGYVDNELLKQWFTPVPCCTTEAEAGVRTHDEMGFHEGWGAALDQLVELMTRRRG
ncbi:MAG: hypothetical protein ACKOCE_03345 [Acidimicrobiia bacterium]